MSILDIFFPLEQLKLRFRTAKGSLAKVKLKVLKLSTSSQEAGTERFETGVVGSVHGDRTKVLGAGNVRAGDSGCAAGFEVRHRNLRT